MWWEINKQMFLMKQEALGTQRGFRLFESVESLTDRLSTSITDTDQGD